MKKLKVALLFAFALLFLCSCSKGSCYMTKDEEIEVLSRFFNEDYGNLNIIDVVENEGEYLYPSTSDELMLENCGKVKLVMEGSLFGMEDDNLYILFQVEKKGEKEYVVHSTFFILPDVDSFEL